MNTINGKDYNKASENGDYVIVIDSGKLDKIYHYGAEIYSKGETYEPSPMLSTVNTNQKTMFYILKDMFSDTWIATKLSKKIKLIHEEDMANSRNPIGIAISEKEIKNLLSEMGANVPRLEAESYNKLSSVLNLYDKTGLYGNKIKVTLQEFMEITSSNGGEEGALKEAKDLISQTSRQDAKVEITVNSASNVNIGLSDIIYEGANIRTEIYEYPTKGINMMAETLQKQKEKDFQKTASNIKNYNMNRPMQRPMQGKTSERERER